MRIGAVRQMQLRGLIEVAAFCAPLLLAVVIHPDPGDPAPALLGGLVAGGIAVFVAFVLLERRLPWRPPRDEQRMARPLKLLFPVIAATVIALMLLNTWLGLSTSEVPPITKDVWLRNQLVSLGSQWIVYSAAVLVPPRPVKRGSAVPPVNRDPRLDNPPFRWPGSPLG